MNVYVIVGGKEIIKHISIWLEEKELSFKRIKPVSLYQNVVKQVINLIKNGDLKAGDKLPAERVLSNKLGISRGSLREALRILEVNGIIRNIPGEGRFIRNIKYNKNEYFKHHNGSVILNLEKSAILELLEAREIIDVNIVKLAAKRANQKDIENIDCTLKKVMNEEKNKSLANNSKNFKDFHLAVAKACHNFVFENIMEWNIHLLYKTRVMTSYIKERSQDKAKEHQQIFEAIKRHDSEKAAELTLKHIKNIKKVIKEINWEIF